MLVKYSIDIPSRCSVCKAEMVVSNKHYQEPFGCVEYDEDCPNGCMTVYLSYGSVEILIKTGAGPDEEFFFTAKSYENQKDKINDAIRRAWLYKFNGGWPLDRTGDI